jgi:tetratricopeptide (TPR) repeat protein
VWAQSSIRWKSNFIDGSKNPAKVVFMKGPKIHKTFSLALAVIFVGVLLFGCQEKVTISNLRLAQVGPYTTTISWECDKSAAFKVVYGEGALFDRELGTADQATVHSVKLTGLKPSTRYAYRIEPGDVEASFRSAPQKDGAFDIAVLDSKSPACRGDSDEFDTNPDIVIVGDDCPSRIAHSPESMLTLRLQDGNPMSLAFGASLLIITSDMASATEQIKASEESAKTIIITRVLPKSPPEALADLPIISPRGAIFHGEIFLLPTSQSAWLEVDAFEIAFAAGKSRAHEKIVIVEAPPETKKTCLYCDRLLESGRYEESLSWYKEFVVENQDRHAVEDAYFSIARLLDEKLFRYSEATIAYERFLEFYPKSRKAMLAEYRLEYIRQHSGEGYTPLSIFEGAKARLIRTDPMPAVVQVESLLSNYPDSSVAQEALYWLGHILETKDPDRATGHYTALMERFPESDNAVAASIALGDIAYRSKRYRHAIMVYETAAEKAPDQYALSIKDKIRKSERNIKREIARWASWLILAVWMTLTVMTKSVPTVSDLKAAALFLIAYTFVGGLLFGLTYEVTKVLLPTTSAIAMIMCLILCWNRALGHKKQRSGWIITVHMLSCSVAALFLIMYHLHHLYIFGV